MGPHTDADGHSLLLPRHAGVSCVGQALLSEQKHMYQAARLYRHCLVFFFFFFFFVVVVLALFSCLSWFSFVVFFPILFPSLSFVVAAIFFSSSSFRIEFREAVSMVSIATDCTRPTT